MCTAAAAEPFGVVSKTFLQLTRGPGEATEPLADRGMLQICINQAAAVERVREHSGAWS